jgi:hypothetical protein
LNWRGWQPIASTMRDVRFPFLRNNNYAAQIDPFGRKSISPDGGGSKTVDLLLSFAWLGAVTWLILRAFKQRGLWPNLALAPPPVAGQAPHIVVIVPARDEASNICRCMNSLLAQDYPCGRFNVLVVDDHSADDTAAIVQRIAAAFLSGTVFCSRSAIPLVH